MAEETKAPDTGISVSTEEIAQFMRTHKDSYACPICASTNWMGMTDGTGRTAGVPWVSAEGSLELDPVRVLTMFCARCGFVRSHELGIFSRHLHSLQGDQE